MYLANIFRGISDTRIMIRFLWPLVLSSQYIIWCCPRSCHQIERLEQMVEPLDHHPARHILFRYMLYWLYVVHRVSLSCTLLLVQRSFPCGVSRRWSHVCLEDLSPNRTAFILFLGTSIFTLRKITGIPLRSTGMVMYVIASLITSIIGIPFPCTASQSSTTFSCRLYSTSFLSLLTFLNRSSGIIVVSAPYPLCPLLLFVRSSFSGGYFHRIRQLFWPL